MAVGLIKAVRRATLAKMKQTATLTALVPIPSIHPAADSPRWPFIRWGTPFDTPRRGTCLNGATISCTIHAFGKPEYNGAGAETKTAEDVVSDIAAEIERALDRHTLALEAGTARMLRTNTQIQPDGEEADAYHAIIEFEARVTAA